MAVPLNNTNLEKLKDQINTYHQCKAQIKDIIYKNKLCQLFKKKGDLTHTSLLATLQATQCSEDNDLHAHLNKMDNIKESLTAMGQPLPNQTYIAYLKLSLPESYQFIAYAVTAGITSASGTVTVTSLTAPILEEYDGCTL
ncbi:hypothetical protein GYMLUDRAFT_243988 [Collybiopsis luxurians FD-317 M1]|uniref:Uncharacterized protein n=1 Tax=Collybiopsis luxurians FD-317 M1 TaxID=944289 RepID=A0A0D0CE74_9AGAR|nr:hypothetical protein GYMLUDRAFT_243988 [Collybiopsis luxurians FD-317 M1]